MAGFRIPNLISLTLKSGKKRILLLSLSTSFINQKHHWSWERNVSKPTTFNLLHQGETSKAHLKDLVSLYIKWTCETHIKHASCIIYVQPSSRCYQLGLLCLCAVFKASLQMPNPVGSRPDGWINLNNANLCNCNHLNHCFCPLFGFWEAYRTNSVLKESETRTDCCCCLSKTAPSSALLPQGPDRKATTK